ncbi:hypothetical protein HPB51_010437 [Rhipicephalus microplus]|uniref:CIP2A N-terminal domain-containing protein n=1 Tax=Rhipicephalus microplus TaxID=6941 RepID=A0A9J6E8E9_RHIMP|nr:hypothetical protein HPB51_010437 [Rhipicephalus microplus]
MEVADVARSFVQSCTLQPAAHEDSTSPSSSSYAQRQLDASCLVYLFCRASPVTWRRPSHGVLNGMLGSRDLTFFAGRSRLAHECVTCCVSILFDVQPNLQLCSKVLTLFQHLAKDPQLLEWLHEEFELHSALAEFFQNRAIEDNVPMQLQVIQLLRDLCYRHQVTLTESKLGYLGDFLFKRMDMGTDELFVPCLELLNHLSWSTSAQQYMKIMPQLPKLCRALVPMTTFDNSCVVMHTLAIFANLSLDEFISNKRMWDENGTTICHKRCERNHSRRDVIIDRDYELRRCRSVTGVSVVAARFPVGTGSVFTVPQRVIFCSVERVGNASDSPFRRMKRVVQPELTRKSFVAIPSLRETVHACVRIMSNDTA